MYKVRRRSAPQAGAGEGLFAVKLMPNLSNGEAEARILRLLQQDSRAAAHVVHLRLAREVTVKAVLDDGTTWSHRAMMIVTKWADHIGLFDDVARDPERSLPALMTTLCRRVYGLLQVLIAAPIQHSFLAQPCCRLAPHISTLTACAVATPPPHAIRCNTATGDRGVARMRRCALGYQAQECGRCPREWQLHSAATGRRLCLHCR